MSHNPFVIHLFVIGARTRSQTQKLSDCNGRLNKNNTKYEHNKKTKPLPNTEIRKYK